MALTYRENYLRAVRFEYPETIPVTFSINAACYHHYPQDFLFDQMEAHKLLFPDFRRPQTPYVPTYAAVQRADTPFRDDFGCLWKTTDNGITGTVVEHPLADLDKLRTYQFPDPTTCMGIGPIHWQQVEQTILAKKAKGQLTHAGLRHGHTFLQLCDLCGYENLLMYMMDEDPRLWPLIEGVETFNRYGVEKYAALGVDVMAYPEDLGMQVGPMLSPAMFRKYIQPSFQRLMKPARDRGILVHMHSDGDIRLLAADLIEGGVDILNLQDLVNSVDWIQQQYTGKICIDLDIDRQAVTCFGTPAQVDALIREETQKLGSQRGGLMLIFGLYPGTPLANITALMDALERYMVL